MDSISEHRPVNRTGKALPKPSHSYVKATPVSQKKMEQNNVDSEYFVAEEKEEEEGEEEEEEYLPFHILPHIRERVLFIYLSFAVIAVRKWEGFNASLALEAYFGVYILLRFVLPVVVELARMGARKMEKMFSSSASRGKKKKRQNDRKKKTKNRVNSGYKLQTTSLLRRSIDLGSRDFIQHYPTTSSNNHDGDQTLFLRVDKQKNWTSNAGTDVPNMSANLAGIVNETHKNAFVDSVVENSSGRKNSAADLNERTDVVWEKIHTGSIESAKMPCKYRMYCSTSSSSCAHGKHVARIKTEIAIDNVDADIVAKVQTDEQRKNVWGNSNTTSRILAKDEEKQCDLIFWRINYPRLMAPRDYIGIRRVWHDEATRSTISVCVDANGSEEAHKKKKHTQVQLGGGGYDVQHLYAGSLIQPKFEDDGAREGDGEKVENGAMLVTIYAEAPGVPRKLVHMTAAKGLDEYMLAFHRELRRERRIQKRERMKRESSMNLEQSFESSNSLGEQGNDASLNNSGEQQLFDDDPDILDEEERAEQRRLRETPLHLRRKARFLRSMLRNGLRKLANQLEEKEEREKLKFQAAASLTDSEKERAQTRRENRQKRRTALRRWMRRTIGVGVVYAAKILNDGKDD